MHLERSIFKAYDIRGIYPSQINAEVAYAIGRGYATYMLKRTPRESLRIVVGHDMRLSSEELNLQLIRGLLDSGISVEDIGMVSTPAFYFAAAYFGFDGGVQVSASHNPKEWNGFKFVGRHGAPMGFKNSLHEILETIEDGNLAPLMSESERGKLQKRTGIMQVALEDQMKEFDMKVAKVRPFKIAIDIGNGMAAEELRTFFGVFPATVIWMNEVPDGSFPAHPADPMREENTADLRKKIVAEHCDFGIACDGDGDRYFFFDERGEAVPQEILRGLLAQIELKQHVGATVVYDIRPGRITQDLIADVGGRAIVAPVGHSIIKEKMIEEKAIFGGESSGHFFYKLPYGCFEAPFVLLYRLLSFLTEQKKPLSQIIAPHKHYFNSGEINAKLENRDQGEKKLKEISEHYKNGFQLTLDGLSVTYPDYWFNVRLSNTEPLIRFIVESGTKQIMEQKRDELKALIGS